MKRPATHLLGGLLLAAAPMLAASAQTSTIDYCNSGGSATIEKRTATETCRATSFTFGSYSTGVNNAYEATTSNPEDVFQLTNQYSNQIDGRALVWRQDNTDTWMSYYTPNICDNAHTPLKARVLLTFSREVTGLTFVIQDIDRATLTSSAATGGSDYTDEVDFYPLDGAGNAVNITSTNVPYYLCNPYTVDFYGPTTIDNYSQVALLGIRLNGTTSAPSRGGNTTISFNKPVKKVWITYRNLNTFSHSNLRLQTIAFEKIEWCAQADLTTTIQNANVGELLAGRQGKFTVAFKNVGDLDTYNVVARVQLPTNLTNVQATNNGVYDKNTGYVTYPVGAIAPYGGQLVSDITYTAPAANTLVQAIATITTTTSEGLNPNPNTAQAEVTPVAPLPVSLTAFAAKASGADVRLTWTTASELNNAYFEVERSTDGVTFAPLGRLSGHGTTQIASAYAYLDAGVAGRLTGRAYYRLRQVDLDGTASYSPVRPVELGAAALATAVGLYPNPAAPTDAAVTLDLRTLPQGAYEVSLVSAVGSTVARYTAQGGQDQALPLPAALASGPYVVLVQGNNLRLAQRLARR